MGRTLFRKELLVWLGLFSVTLVMYTNCSEQQFRFTPTEESLRSALNTGGILIESGREFTSSSDVRLTLFSQFGTSMYITNDSTCATGGQWEDYQEFKPWSLSKSNQSVSVYVKYRDEDGVISDCLSDEIVHDNVAPTVVYEKKPKELTKEAKASFVLKAYDNLSQVESLLCSNSQNGAYTPCSETFSIQASNEGSQSMFVKAVDRAGNQSAPYPHHWMYDSTKPTLRLTQQPEKVTASTQATFQVVGEDNLSKISKYLCAQGSDPLKDCEDGHFSYQHSGPDGALTARFQVIDGAGNASDVLTYGWSIDQTKPSVEITKSPAAFVNTNSATLEFRLNSKQRGPVTYSCSLNGASVTPCTSPQNLSGLAEGLHEFQVTAHEVVGGHTLVSAAAKRVWTVDTTAPVIQIAEKPARVTNQQSATVLFTVTETGSGVADQICQIDGVQKPCSQNNAATADGLTEGSHNFSVKVTDRAGNTATAHADWTVDLTKPIVHITSGPDEISNLTQAQFTFTGQDASGMSGYTCRLNQLSAVPCSSPVAYNSLAEGKHVFGVRGKDKAGNESDEVTEEWTVDLTGPAIVFSRQPTDHADDESTRLTFEVSDALGSVREVYCGFKGALSRCSAATDLTLTNLSTGTKVYRVEAVDHSGNSSFAEVSWNVTYGLENKSTVIPVGYNDKVDILFVVDNSGSMSNIQNQLASRINGFISKLAGLNWQIMVTTTDTRANTTDQAGRTVPWGDGQLRSFGLPGSPLVLNPSHANAQQHLGTAITVGARGSGDERGINATYRFVERYKSSATTLRPGAAFTSIVISDEDECSTGCGQSVAKSKPENLVNLVKTHLGQDKIFVFNALIGIPEDRSCLSSSQWGNTYARLQAMTNGILGSVCSSDYAAHLSELGTKVAGLVRSVQLECAPVDTSGDGLPDVRVLLEAGQTPPSFSVSGSLVTFSQHLPKGNHRFEYACRR